MPTSIGSIVGLLAGLAYYHIVALNIQLRKRVSHLEKLLPICAHCKSIRLPESQPEEQKNWETLEEYITSRTQSEFSHTVCPDCLKKHYAEFQDIGLITDPQ